MSDRERFKWWLTGAMAGASGVFLATILIIEPPKPCMTDTTPRGPAPGTMAPVSDAR